MQKMPITGFIDSFADFFVNASDFDDKTWWGDFGFGKKDGITNLENEDLLRTEIFIAELFAAQLPIAAFLKDRGQPELMDAFFREVINLLKKRGYFQIADGVDVFNFLVEQRFPEYHAITQKEAFYTNIIARSVALRCNQNWLFENAFTSILTQTVTELNDLIKQINDRVELTDDTTSKIITYQNGNGRSGSGIQLHNGESIFISVTRSGVVVSKLSFMRLLATKTIWQSNDLDIIFKKLAIVDTMQLLDALIREVVDCRSISEVRERLSAIA